MTLTTSHHFFFSPRYVTTCVITDVQIMPVTLSAVFFFLKMTACFLKSFTDINFSSISTATSAVEFGFESRREKIKDALRARHFDDTRQLSHAKFDI